jgi:Cu-Zn family superoxide dismutase
MKCRSPLMLLMLTAFGSAAADQTVTVKLVDDHGIGEAIGQVTVSQTSHGVVFSPQLKELPPGMHGFHIHEHASCEAQEKEGKPTAALAAGGHYDPMQTKRHGAPWGDGHRGDLPALYVDAQGKAEYSVLAPRLKLSDLKGHALMIHAGGDNYADQPAPLGGGGARIACGVF